MSKWHDRTHNNVVTGCAPALDVAQLGKALKIPKSGGKKGRRIFWNSTSDTFHERLSFTEIAAQFAVMAARPDLRFLVLTKRPERARAFFAEYSHTGAFGTIFDRLWAMFQDATGLGATVHRFYHDGSTAWPLPNVAIGVSAEDQKRWDTRIRILLEMKERGDVAIAYVSAEPLIGPIVMGGDLYCPTCNEWAGTCPCAGQRASIDQVIIGAEAGPGARPMPLEWARDLGRQVLDAQRVCDCLFTVGGDEPARLSCTACQGRGRSGPALFVKQAAVCESCHGMGAVYLDAGTITGCTVCDGLNGLHGTGTGKSKKVRKHCPRFWIPGHGARSWDQHFWRAA